MNMATNPSTRMKHADKRSSASCFWGGLPNLQDPALMIGESVEEVIKCDLSLEVLTPDLSKQSAISL